ncbi:L-carnitine dehydratase/bile acid-inducible protein F [hydrothermal vent metagenome]|jgi:crotonobetainyl-CoA:carnitine CoA-transferase CaiB-like acyl-CoA transferase|uniref:L-carnitine dehydratase/bile acid-inducible protein F n=1 Tax=hydrothermal vent metagenome TaxID=652676 RepID=A0A160TVI7_9ZZZZ|nr:CoA transferase [Gammaproteobacteria bacterium]|tara:strand:+ start:3990 stop:5207 length:1218 start_codon:yes stop_codon:yes gene_type:complete
MSGPLNGIRVFDLTRVLAGPSCTQILGDLGADVIKIERPEHGDDTRKYGPPFVLDVDGTETTESGYYLSANRNKRSVTLNLTGAEGQSLAKRMINQCQVLAENFKVGNLAKFGLDYASLKAENPGLVYCSITGFGQTGPKAKRPGYDFMAQGLGGIMSITGPPGGEPHRVGIPIADLTAGLWATISINAALRHREVTGEGQHLDISLLDTQVSLLSIQGLNYLTSGEVPGLLGNAHPNIVPYQVFPTADGNIIVAVGNDDQFKRYCEFAGVPELINDERFVTNKARVQNREALTQILNEVMRQNPSAYWLEELEKNKITCGPINNIDQVFADTQVVARDMRIEMNHPATGGEPVSLIGSPSKMSVTEVSYRHAPPMLGQHTEEVLEELLGLDAAECNRLREQGVI